MDEEANAVERLLVHYSFQCGQKRWKLVFHRLPHDTDIYVEIGVYNSIAHSDHVLPRNLRVTCACFERHARRGFANNLNTPHERMLQLAVLSRRFEINIVRKLDGLTCSVNNMA